MEMRRVKVINRITLEFNRDELEEIRDLLLVLTEQGEIDKTTIEVAADWINVLNENIV